MRVAVAELDDYPHRICVDLIQTYDTSRSTPKSDGSEG